MKLINEKIKLPSFADILKVINNQLFDENEIKLELVANTEEDEFKFSLKGEAKDLNFLINTTISIEHHKENEKHKIPHIQCDLSKSDDEFFNGGNLHINLLVNTEEELLACCKGFIKIVGEILEHFEKELQLENSLINHFFNEGIVKFEEHKITLHQFIEKAQISNEFEIKHMKAFNFNDLNKEKQLFYVIRLFHAIPMLKPLLQTPCYNQFIKIPHIKKQNIKFEDVDVLIMALLAKNHELERYTPEKISMEFKRLN